jgi:hypothetical protein
MLTNWIFSVGYFICPGVGKFADPTLFPQGKYFDCTNVGGSKTRRKKFLFYKVFLFLLIAIQIQQKSCPRGLRFNANANICTY